MAEDIHLPFKPEEDLKLYIAKYHPKDSTVKFIIQNRFRYPFYAMLQLQTEYQSRVDFLLNLINEKDNELYHIGQEWFAYVDLYSQDNVGYVKYQIMQWIKYHWDFRCQKFTKMK